MTDPLLINGHKYDKIQIVYLPSPYSGFSAMVTYILSGVRRALMANNLPVAYIDKSKARFFYDPSRGENIWEYYFEPVMGMSYDNAQTLLTTGAIARNQVYLEKKKNLRRLQQTDPGRIITYWDRQFDETPEKTSAFMAEKRALGREYVRRFIRVKPAINSKVDQFFESGIEPAKLIGIHIRGTDLEYVSATPIQRYYAEVDKLLDSPEYAGHQIFLATDQSQFVSSFKERYGDNRIITYDSLRSSGTIAPYRLKGAPAYKKGEDVLIDILILSRCNYIIKSASAVGELALWFTKNENFTDLALETRRLKSKADRIPAYLSLNVDNIDEHRLRKFKALFVAAKYIIKKIPFVGSTIRNYSQGKWF